MSITITKATLIAAYELLRATPPFVGWKLPDADTIDFAVLRGRTTYGDCDGETIRASSGRHGHLPTLLATVAHEMIHLHQMRRKLETPNTEHNADFRNVPRASAGCMGLIRRCSEPTSAFRPIRMTHTVLVLVVFLLSGEPQAYAATLAPGVVCDAAQAVNFARQVEVQLREPIQEEILWQCIPVQSPGAATVPDAPRRRVPGANEASICDAVCVKGLVAAGCYQLYFLVSSLGLALETPPRANASPRTC